MKQTGARFITWMLLTVALSTSGWAAGLDIYWTNTNGGVLTDTANWRGGVVPDNSDKAMFTNPGTYTVNLTGNYTNRGVIFDADGSFITVNLGGYYWQAATNDINQFMVGQITGRVSQVLVTNGEIRSSRLHVGGNRSFGSLTLRDTIATVTNASGFVVGTAGGTGLLTIADAQSVINVTSNGTGSIGESAGSWGHVVLSNGLLSITGGTDVGESGVGALTVVRGTNYNTGTLTVGRRAGSVGTVTLTEPAAVVRGGLTLGGAYDSQGYLFLSNGNYYGWGETYIGQSGTAVAVLSGGNYWVTNGGGHVYIPFNTGTGKLVLASAESTFALDGSYFIQVPDKNGLGEIIMSNGTIRSPSMQIGAGAGGYGQLSIYNATNAFINTGDGKGLIIGEVAGATGLVIMADERALMTANDGTGTGGGIEVGTAGEGTLIVSNGTIYTKGLYLGQSSGGQGTAFIQDARVYVQTNAFAVANGGGSRGWFSIDHPDAVLDNRIGAPTAIVGGGSTPGGQGDFYVSNGLARFSSLIVASTGRGYVEVGAATLTIDNALVMPRQHATSCGTGVFAMISADAYVVATNSIALGADLTDDALLRKASASLLVSNGTMRVGLVEVGRRGNGYMYIGAATVAVERTGDSGFNLGAGSYSQAGTGILVIAHPGSLLESSTANIRVGVQPDSTALLQFSNGVMNIANLRMGVGLASRSEVWMGDSTINSTGDWQFSTAANSTSRFTMAHANALIEGNSGSIQLNTTGSNSVSVVTVSNGTIRTTYFDIGSSSGTPSGNGELWIHAGTVTLSRADQVQYAMNLGGTVGNTGRVVLTKAVSELNVTNGGRLRIGNSGTAFVMVSNGVVRARDVRLGESDTGWGELSIRDGSFYADARLLLAALGRGVVNLDHANAFLQIGTGGLSMAEFSAGRTNAWGALNLSNGTVRFTTPGIDHALGSYTQTGVCSAVINVFNGTFDFNGGNVLLGNRTRTYGALNISGGTTLVNRITLLGVSAAGAGAATGTLSVSDGILYLGGLTSTSATPGAQSNVLFSGGTLRSLADFTSTLSITLTNAPGAGLVTFDIWTNTVNLSGILNGPGRLKKTGSGKLQLHQANTYGGTEVSGGILAVQYRVGSGTGTGRLDVLTGGALIGTGAVSSLNLGGGTISPGFDTNAPGTQLAGPMNWTNGVYRWDVQNFVGSQWDTLVGTGALTIASGMITVQVVSVSGGGQLGAADNYDISAGYTCIIATATSIGGFDAGKFTLDTSGFANDEGAIWSISTISTNLVLVITPPGSSSRAVYWDANATTPGIQSGSGVWTEGSNSWQVGGVAPNVAWDNTARDKALFSYQSTGPHTVRVDFAVATNSGISMPTAGTLYTYEINGTGTLELTGQSQSFHVEQPTANLIVGTPIRIPSGGLVKSGSGTLYLENPTAEYDGGVLVKTGKLYIGRGGTSGELGGGLVTLMDGGPELYFNRSSYAITNPISGGRTYITNSGGGYAWRAGATQDFLMIRNNTTITQEVGDLVYTNYVRVDSWANTAVTLLKLVGGSLTAPAFQIGETGTGTARVEVAGGTLLTKTNSVGGGSNNGKGAALLLSSGEIRVENSQDLGKAAGTQSNSFTQTGGFMAIASGTFIVRSNGVWTQTGGVFTNDLPSSTAGCEIQGLMDLQGGSFHVAGSYLRVGMTTRTRFGEISQLLITNDASLYLVEANTNISRPTYLAVAAAANATGRVLVAGGSLVLTNSLGVYSVSGVIRSNSGDIVLGVASSAHGILDIQGGSARAYQVWFGGFDFTTASSGALGRTSYTGTRSDLFMSGGELYTMRGFSNYNSTACSSNVHLSGGTLGALGPWVSGLTLTLTNSPGPGVTRFDPNGNRMTLAGVLQGPGGLSMDGLGTLVISNNNGGTLSALNFVSNGFLEVGNGAGAALGSNTLIVTALGSLGGTGRVSRVNFQQGGWVSPGLETNVGALTAGATIWSNTSYRFEIMDFNGAYGTGWDRFSSTGTLTIASGSMITVRVASLNAAGVVGAALNYSPTVTFTTLLASAASISGFDAGSFVLDTTDFLNDEVIASIQIVNVTNIGLVVAPGVAGNNRLLYWDADRNTAGVQNGTGTWNGILANWRTAGGANLAWNNGRQDYAILDGAAGAGSWTVSVNGISSATNVGFSFLNNGGTYTVDGTGYLNFAASTAMVTADAPGTVSARLEGAGFTKVGAAALTLNGSNQHSGVITVSNGALRLANAWALGGANGGTVVASGAEIVAAVSGSPSIRDPLSISGTGTNGAGALRFSVSSATWVGTVTVAGASTRIGVDVGLNATLSTVVTGGVADVFVGGAGRLLANGGVQLGSGKIVKDGTGVLSLRGASAYSGGTIVSAGTLRVCGSCAANVAGTAAILLENNTTLGSETASSTIGNPLNIWGNVQLVDSAYPFNKDLIVTGAVALNSAVRTITVPTGMASLTGPISSGGLNKKGSGTLLLGGANTYASPTIVSNGTLIINGTNSNSAVTSIAGTKLIGAGSLAATTVNGELDAGPLASAVGTMTASSLTLRPSSSVRVTITNATSAAGLGFDTINCVGTLTISATAGGGECVIIPDSLGKTPANFNNASTYTWKIIDAGALSGYDASKFTVSSAAFSPALGGGYFSITTIGSDVYLKFLPATQSNLRLSVTDSPDPVGLNGIITYTITVTNLSQSAPAPDMVLTNRLDDQLVYQSNSGGGTYNAGEVTWSLSSLAGGGYVTVTVLAQANIYGIHTNVAHVSTDVPDALEDDNWATNVTEVGCVESLTPIFTSTSAKSVVVNNPLTFTVTAYDSGCYPPSMTVTGLPAGATFSTSNYYPTTQFTYGTITWTPGPSQTGTFPVRFIATDSEPNSTSMIVRVYVAGASEPTNSSGVPQSQTNWHVAITNMVLDGSDATVVWTSGTGLTYDVYTSVGQLGGSISWTRLTNGYEASGSLSTGEFSAAETRRYFKVVLENEGVRDSNGVWAVIRPTINVGYNLVSVPVDFPSRSFYGELGSNLAAVLTGDNDGIGTDYGDEVLIMNDNGSTYRTLWLDGAGPPQWHVSGGGSDTLEPGQGFFVLRKTSGTVYPTFTGPVGTFGAKTSYIVQGWNLIGLAEGWYNVTFNRVFGSPVSGSLNASWDDDGTADQIQALNDGGSYSRFWYAPDGWRNAANDQLATTNTFLPGKAYYFKRASGDLEVSF